MSEAPDLSSPETSTAVEVVRTAALLALRVQQQINVSSLEKADRSPVTVADFTVQAVIARELADRFPELPLVAEEDAGALRSAPAILERVVEFVRVLHPTATTAEVCDWIDLGKADATERFWTLDPIDGTKGFLRGEQYAVALALIDRGRVQLGVVGCPHLTSRGVQQIGGGGGIFLAQLNHGSWAVDMQGEGQWRRLEVSTIDEVTRARVLRSVEKAHTNTGQFADLIRALGTDAQAVFMDSQAKYAALASGNGDLLLRLLSPSRPDYREKIWDQAAGSILVQEAGGRATDLRGRTLDFGHGRTLAVNRGVVASNGRLHEEALETLRRVSAV